MRSGFDYVKGISVACFELCVCVVRYRLSQQERDFVQGYYSLTITERKEIEQIIERFEKVWPSLLSDYQVIEPHLSEKQSFAHWCFDIALRIAKQVDAVEPVKSPLLDLAANKIFESVRTEAIILEFQSVK